jgi:hypothetical protein
MRRSSAIIAISLLFCVVRNAEAQNKYYLSQIANGGSGGSNYRTAFVLFNNTDSDATASLKLTADNGSPLTVTLEGLGTGSSFELFIAAGASQFLQTDGRGPTVTGAATVTASARLGVSAIFSIYNDNGEYITEAGVGSSEALTEFVLPVDTTGLFNTGLAILNTGSLEATLTLSLRGVDGAAVDQTTRTLAAGAHVAQFVAGTNQFFPALGSFQGTLLVRSTTPVAALVLRQNQTPLSFTSLPVVTPSPPRLTQNLAQVVNGSFGGGSYRTSFLLFNLTSRTANAVLALTKDDSTPLVVTIPGRGTDSTFQVAVPGNGSVFLQTDGSGAVAAGGATLTSTEALGSSAIFTVLGADGKFMTEAGVGDSQVLDTFTLPVDLTGTFDTGVAFLNPGNSSSRITLRLLDATGGLFDPGTAVDLRAKGHTAKFVSELFPGTRNFRGSMTVSASSPVAALTLRQNLSPLSYTTLPVVSGLATGRAPEAPVLPRSRTGVAITANQTVNETLPSGFRLTGQVLGDGRADYVAARRSDGALFTGSVNADTGRFTIALGEGSYTLQVCYHPVSGAAWGTITSTFADPNPVQVSADTTRHITLPGAALFSVSGDVQGVANLPEITDAQVVLTSVDSRTQVSVNLGADGKFQGMIPNGSYRAGIAVPLVIFSQFQNESLAVYDIGSVNVSGGPVTASLTAPSTARITGSVNATWLGSLAFGLKVLARDRAANAVDAAACCDAPATSAGNADPTKQYQLVVPRNRSYAMGVTVPLRIENRFLGTLDFPMTTDAVDLSADVIHNFNIPDVPERMTLSGTVTDSRGRALEGVSVIASVQGVTGAPTIGFTASASTDGLGNYSMPVLSGTGYQIQFIPAPPFTAEPPKIPPASASGPRQ